jgi:hypothetical protein
MKKNLPIKITSSLLGLGLFLFSNAQLVLADERDFTIIPPKTEVSAKPGEVISTVVKLKNNTNTSQSFEVGASDFIVKDKKGSPDFTETEENNWVLTNWLSFSPKILTIEPGQIGYVSVNISVPENALPGGRYASIYFSQPGIVHENNTASSVGAELRNLILLRIAGPIEESAVIRQFSAPKLSENGPIALTTEIANLGNYHISPVVGIEIKNMFGQTVLTQRLDERNIFPKTSFEYENLFGSKWLFGKFQANLTGAYGEQNLPLNATIYFWVWPIKLTAFILALVATIVFTILLLKKLKKMKKDKPEIEENN